MIKTTVYFVSLGMTTGQREKVKMEKVESDNRDVLVMDGEWQGWKHKMVLVYCTWMFK